MQKCTRTIIETSGNIREKSEKIFSKKKVGNLHVEGCYIIKDDIHLALPIMKKNMWIITDFSLKVTLLLVELNVIHRPDEAMIETWKSLSLKQINSAYIYIYALVFIFIHLLGSTHYFDIIR